MNISPAPPSALISVDEVKRRLTAVDPTYGKDFSDQDWRKITLRIDQLAKLLWRMAQRPELPTNDGSGPSAKSK